MQKPRFGLRILLALPLCVAAFYVGWTTHAWHLKSQHDRESVAAQQRRADIQRQLADQRAVWETRRNDSLDRIDHRERMRSYDRLLDDPNAGKMLPAGTF